MSDEQITISVDDSEIDAAIAKLDEALEKTAQLTGETPTETEVPYIIPSAEMAEVPEQPFIIPYAEMPHIIPAGEIEQYNEATARLDDLEAHSAEAEADVEDTVVTGTAKLTDLEAEAENAKANVDEAIEEGAEIKGLDSASSRIIRMIPGLREAQRIQRSIGMLSEGSIMGGLSLLLVAYSIYRQISAMLAEQEQQRAEYRKMVMEARGFTLKAQFTQWQEDQRRTIEDYRNRVIP
jgi:hypothetical protein